MTQLNLKQVRELVQGLHHQDKVKLMDWLGGLIRAEEIGKSETHFEAGSLQRFAEVASSSTISTGVSNTVEHSREILNEEFADYLVDRLNDNG